MNRGVHIYLNADPEGPLLLVDPERVADLSGGLDTAVGGLYAARRAKLPLYRGLGAGEAMEPSLIALEDVHELVAVARVETARDRETRSRYQRFIDRRRAARRAHAEELGLQDKERREAEELAIKRGLHADFLDQKARAEAVQAQRAQRQPLAPEFDPDLSTWADQGEPEAFATVPPAPEPVDPDEGEIL